jgi:hypothetical protein
MNDINKLLTTLTSNEEIKNEANAVSSSDTFDEPLFSGIPDPFGSPRINKPQKRQQTPIEYESSLIKTIEALNHIASAQSQLSSQMETIWNQLHESKKELSIMVADEKFANNEKAQIKYELLDEALQTIGSQIPDKQYRRPKEIQVDLTQAQIVILFHNMQKLGMVGKNIPNTLLAKSISDMTGLSKEKIRQALSTIKEDSGSIESIAYTENDYHRVKNKIQSLKDKIHEEIESRF